MPSLFSQHPDVSDAAGYACVAVEQSIDVSEAGLTYAIPPALAHVQVGQRVQVPLGRGNRPAWGYLVERLDPQALTPQGNIAFKPMLRIDERSAALPADLLELARWIARYYVAPLGMVLSNMVPAAVKKATGDRPRLLIRPAQPGPAPVGSARMSTAQKAILEHLGSTGQWHDARAIQATAGVRTSGPIKRMAEQGLLETRYENQVEGDLAWQQQSATPTPPFAHQLTADQAQTLAALQEALTGGFGVHLLHGVTASGKTEVYLRLIATLRQRAREGSVPGVIVLVPEIALTPQTIERFRNRFEDVAVLHSGLTASQRHGQWRRIFEGRSRLVVGTRSAIFAPVQDLALIIVDEEHDTSYKQDQLPRYHGRDVAIKRAQLAGHPVVLGSATPALESYAHAVGTATTPPAWHYHPLRERIPGTAMPVVELVNMVDERRRRYEMTGRSGWHLFSLRLEHVLRQTLKEGGQAIILLNRRGYANYIACPDAACGWVMTCHHCDVTMVYHRLQSHPQGGYLRCHHCSATQQLPSVCPACSKKVNVFGMGTQRVQEELHRIVPEASVGRMDGDSMRSARDYDEMLEGFGRGAVQVLLGTQMVAKGLDFPNVHLVGILSADMPMHLADFRSSERTFQLITQVTGRAGRAEHPGRAIVQTYNPNDPALTDAAAHDYERFAQRELAIRAQCQLPPTGRLVRLIQRDRREPACRAAIHQRHSELEALNTKLDLGIRLIGPMPCTIGRVADFFRWQLELQAHGPRAAARLQALLSEARRTYRLISNAQLAIDVDPVSAS